MSGIIAIKKAINRTTRDSGRFESSLSSMIYNYLLTIDTLYQLILNKIPNESVIKRESKEAYCRHVHRGWPLHICLSEYVYYSYGDCICITREPKRIMISVFSCNNPRITRQIIIQLIGGGIQCFTLLNGNISDRSIRSCDYSTEEFTALLINWLPNVAECYSPIHYNRISNIILSILN